MRFLTTSLVIVAAVFAITACNSKSSSNLVRSIRRRGDRGGDVGVGHDQRRGNYCGCGRDSILSRGRHASIRQQLEHGLQRRRKGDDDR